MFLVICCGVALFVVVHCVFVVDSCLLLLFVACWCSLRVVDVGVCCLLCVGCCFVFVGRCVALSVVRWFGMLLFLVFSLLLVVWLCCFCVLLGAYCVLCVICCSLSGVFCLACVFVVCCSLGAFALLLVG